MASKFQNRLVGTIILSALGVILVPGLLDGGKKYQAKFTSIPLVPNLGDRDELDKKLSGIQPGSQPFPILSPTPEGVEKTGNQFSRAISSDQPEELLSEFTINDPIEYLVLTEMKTSSQTAKIAKKPIPQGKAWTVQLGTLKNIDKVVEIVAKLRQSGYHVYTTPVTPVQGQITRIYVGPEVSKKKLQSALGELNQFSGLNGQLQPYKVY